MGKRLRLLPLEPLEALVAEAIAAAPLQANNHKGVATVLNPTDKRELLRARRRGGIAITRADRLAIHLGRHPSEVWPEWHALGDGLSEEVSA